MSALEPRTGHRASCGIVRESQRKSHDPEASILRRAPNPCVVPRFSRRSTALWRDASRHAACPPNIAATTGSDMDTSSAEQTSRPREFASLPWLLVLAASAGGLKALTSILQALPYDLPAAVVIVQHRPPTGSALRHVLARSIGTCRTRPSGPERWTACFHSTRLLLRWSGSWVRRPGRARRRSD